MSHAFTNADLLAKNSLDPAIEQLAFSNQSAERAD
jgi:hypothetical protein